MTVSVRSYLVAGLVAATVGTAAIVPVNPAGRTDADALSLRSSTFDLSAAVSPLIQPFTAAVLGLAGTTAEAAPGAAAVAAATGSAGEAIINTFNAIEPFVQYGFELTAWAAGYLPWPIGWLGQQINIAYNTGEPIVQALVYSFAYLIDGQFDLIGLTLTYGLNLAVTNFVQGEINWVLSFLPPLPPLPPPPPFPTAAVASRAVAAAPVDAAPVDVAPVDAAPIDASPVDASPVDAAPETSAVPELVAETPAPRGTRAVNRRVAAARQSLPTPAAVNTASAGLVANTVDAADAAAAVEAPSAAPVKEPRRAARSAAVRAGSSGADPAGSSARSAGTDD